MTRYITPEALIDLRFKGRARPSWDIGILSFRGRVGCEALVRKLGARPVGRPTLYGLEESVEHPHVYEALLGGQRIGLVGRCLWGGPQAAILVEELAHLGVRVIIGFGVAGSLVPDLCKGTQIVASTAVVTDGTSRAYTEQEAVPPDAELAAMLDAVARGLAVDVAPATIATVDALYRETPDDVRRWLARGAVAINMETAPLYAAAARCGVKSVWLGHVSDSLSLTTHEWESWVRPAAMTDVSAALTVALIESLADARA